ncbi:cysteine proteinase [Neoconidiobolus thromboides FSU 785]|nr:cysteine proteinase [Neoconidiobolus thromboides FSU 785]
MDMVNFEQKIKDEEANSHPLVSIEEPLSNLISEYINGSKIFIQKIDNLSKTHSKFRRCRGDGNCFYIALTFSIYEKILDGTMEAYLSFYEFIKNSPSILKKAGFQSIVIEDFYDITIEQLKNFSPGHPKAKDPERKQILLSVFQTDEISNAIVVYFRFLTSAFLKLNSDDYLPFILDDPCLQSYNGSNTEMDHFCNLNVEAMGKESDEIHITILATFLSLPIKVAYLDGHSSVAESPHVNFLDYTTKSATEKGYVSSPITLLYRPGHYDIVYE